MICVKTNHDRLTYMRAGAMTQLQRAYFKYVNPGCDPQYCQKGRGDRWSSKDLNFSQLTGTLHIFYFILEFLNSSLQCSRTAASLTQCWGGGGGLDIEHSYQHANQAFFFLSGDRGWIPHPVVLSAYSWLGPAMWEVPSGMPWRPNPGQLLLNCRFSPYYIFYSC